MGDVVHGSIIGCGFLFVGGLYSSFTWRLRCSLWCDDCLFGSCSVWVDLVFCSTWWFSGGSRFRWTFGCCWCWGCWHCWDHCGSRFRCNRRFAWQSRVRRTAIFRTRRCSYGVKIAISVRVNTAKIWFLFIRFFECWHGTADAVAFILHHLHKIIVRILAINDRILYRTFAVSLKCFVQIGIDVCNIDIVWRQYMKLRGFGKWIRGHTLCLCLSVTGEQIKSSNVGQCVIPCLKKNIY